MTVGKLFGIEVRVDPSWLVIFFLILWTFGFQVFPLRHPELSTVTHVIMGVVGTALFFGSVLIHELSHSLVSRARGIPVPAITLFIFGGMSHTAKEAEVPADEFLIAVVGPLASFVLAALFWAFKAVGEPAGWSGAVTGVAGYLATLNLVLAIFNLVPGFPLDGGRIFRAAAWKWTGDMTRATRIAATGGSIVGFLLIALGVLEIVMGAVGGGIWLVFIGWFLRNAARASYEAHLRGGGRAPSERPA